MATTATRLVPALLLLAAAGASWAAGDVPAEALLGDDFFSAGSAVVLERPITGDALMAGGTVESNASVGGDAIVAAGDVAMRATVGDDLYAAGGQVEIDALVAGNARIAGGSVRITPESRLEGGVAIAGGSVDARGTFGRYLSVAGGEVVLGGDVAGDVRVLADTFTVLPGTRIGGSLRYRVADTVTLPPDLVTGGGTEVLPPAQDATGGGGFDRTAGRAGWLWFAGLVAVGLLLAALLGRQSLAASRALAAQPWMGLLLGAAVLVLVPAVAAVLLVTLVGIPLALIVMLVYGALLIVGYVVGALFLGDQALLRLRGAGQPTTGWRLLALVAVLLLAGWLADVPVLGGLVRPVVLLLGLGGLVLVVRGPAPPRAPAPPPSHPPSVV